MFEKLKNIFAGIGYAVKYGDLIRSVLTAWNSYPGLENSEALRKWIKPLLLDASTLALVTKTPIDDTIIIAALRIIDNDRSWTAVHSLALLARDGGELAVPSQTELPLELDNPLPLGAGVNERNNVKRTICGRSLPPVAARDHAAIGLILFLLQQRQR